MTFFSFREDEMGTPRLLLNVTFALEVRLKTLVESHTCITCKTKLDGECVTWIFESSHLVQHGLEEHAVHDTNARTEL